MQDCRNYGKSATKKNLISFMEKKTYGWVNMPVSVSKIMECHSLWWYQETFDASEAFFPFLRYLFYFLRTKRQKLRTKASNIKYHILTLSKIWGQPYSLTTIFQIFFTLKLFPLFTIKIMHYNSFIELNYFWGSHNSILVLHCFQDR